MMFFSTICHYQNRLVMKKLLVVVALVASALVLNAQTPQGGAAPKGKKEFDPEKMAQFAAQKMSEELLLTDEAAAKFIPVYKQYKADFAAIVEKYRPKKGEVRAQHTDADVDAEIRAGFVKSQEILDLRVNYYEKFCKVLSARQIKQMYRVEKEFGDRSRERFQGGPGEPRPGEPRPNGRRQGGQPQNPVKNNAE